MGIKHLHFRVNMLPRSSTFGKKLNRLCLDSPFDEWGAAKCLNNFVANSFSSHNMFFYIFYFDNFFFLFCQNVFLQSCCASNIKRTIPEPKQHLH